MNYFEITIQAIIYLAMLSSLFHIVKSVVKSAKKEVR